MKRRWSLVAALLLSGCLFAPEEEGAEIEASERVDVVPEEGPFDPSKAIEDTGRGEVEESAGEEQPEKTEEVATEGQAEAREERAEETVERINESAAEDEQAKAAAASNPPAEDPGSGERWTVALLDWTLELVVILALALVLSLPCWLLLRSIGAARRRRWRPERRPLAPPRALGSPGDSPARSARRR
jgi:hypothetical protein